MPPRIRIRKVTVSVRGNPSIHIAPAPATSFLAKLDAARFP